PENIVGQSLSVGFRPLPQTTPKWQSVLERRRHKTGSNRGFLAAKKSGAKAGGNLPLHLTTKNLT
ncbi:hypothetical protein, partial [Comamonas jiangduensis]